MLLAAAWPTTDKPGGYELTVTIGWPDANSVPAAIKRGILMIADQIYNGNITDIEKMPKVIQILTKYKVYQL